MNHTIPNYIIIMVNGGRTFGGFTLPGAVEIARQTELAGCTAVVKIMWGAEIVLEGPALRREMTCGLLGV